MKFLLILQGGADWPVGDDHERFRRVALEAGELIGGETLADPSTGQVVGSAAPSGIRGYYLVDVESAARAVELARLLPGGGGRAVEVRPVMFPAGADY
jgi:hypothetical protein